MFTVCCNSHLLGRKLECKAICKRLRHTHKHVPVAVTFRWIKTGLFSFFYLCTSPYHWALWRSRLNYAGDQVCRPFHSVAGILQSKLCADLVFWEYISLTLHPTSVARPGSVWSVLCAVAFVGNCLRNHTLERDKIPVVFIFLTFLKQCKK